MADIHAILPGLITAPLRIVPDVVHSSALVLLLNRLFRQQIADGEMNFLENKILCIRIEDMGIQYRITKKRSRLVAVDRHHPVDASIFGNLYDFMLLATRREDHDSLFFQRRLWLEGDTEVGLQLKNLLDSLEYVIPNIPAPLRIAAGRAFDLYGRFLSR